MEVGCGSPSLTSQNNGSRGWEAPPPLVVHRSLSDLTRYPDGHGADRGKDVPVLVSRQQNRRAT